MFKEIFSYADIYMPLLPLIVFLFIKKKIPKKEYPIIWFALINFIVFFGGDIMAVYLGNNLITYHFYFVYEMIFVAWYFCRNLFKRFSPLFYIISGSFVLFWIVDVIMWEPLNTFPSFAAMLEKILVIFLCMYYLFQFAKSDRIMNFQRLPDFWITSAFLVASAMEIFAAGFFKYFGGTDLDAALNSVIIDLAGVSFKFIFLTIALLCYKRQSVKLPMSLL